MTQKDICIKLDLVSSLVAKKYTDKKLKRLKKTNDNELVYVYPLNKIIQE